MQNFINTQDYDATIHREILDALTRDDAAIIEVCEDRAVAEMKSYLAKRYDTESIFSAAGEDRHPLILMMAVDIAIYHIFCIHNPQKLSQVRRERYERAVQWLKEVADEEVSIDGAPRLEEGKLAQKARLQFRSNPKRHNSL